MAEIASAFVSIAPEAKGFGSKLDSEVGSEVSKSGQKSGKMFGTAMKAAAAGVLAGAAVVGTFLKGSIEEAREAQKVGALTASTIKATGAAANVTAKQVGDLAGAISLKTGIDDEVIQSGQNMLLTFKNIRNETGKGNDIFNQATETLVDMSAAMGSEPKQAAIQLGKALNDPIKGISALSRVGVTFTESQQKVIEKLVKGGETAKAQKIILGELNSEFGGAAAAQATAGDKMAVAWGNLQEAVGTALLPTVDRLLGGLTRLTIFLANSAGPAIKQFLTEIRTGTGTGGKFADMAREAVAVLIQVATATKSVVGFFREHRTTTIALVAAMTALLVVTKAHAAVLAVQAAGGLVAYIKGIRIVAAVTRVWAAVQWAMNAALTANPIGLVIVAIAALVAGLVIAWKKSETFRNVVTTALNAVAQAGIWLWNNALQPAFSGIVRGIAWVIDQFGSLLHALSKVPGFGWAESAANAMDAAGAAARGLADSIVKIPENKTVNLNVNENWVTTRTIRTSRGFGPALASGGIVTRPTLALVGEGRESEAVMPLSKLSRVIDDARAAGGAAGNGRATFHLYDNDGVLMGSIDGRIQAHEDLRGQTARAM